MIREGYFSYYGALFEIIVPGPIIENEDGTTSFLEPEPCYNCGSTDLELIINELYDTPLYSVRCTKCLYSVSEEIKYYAASKKEGFLKAVEHWNIFCMFYYRAKKGYYDDFPTDKELYQPDNLHNTIARLKAMSMDPYLEELKKITRSKSIKEFLQDYGTEKEIDSFDLPKLYPFTNHSDTSK